MRPFRDALYTIVARTHMQYTYAAKVWDLSIVQGPFSVAPCQTLALRYAFFDRCNVIVPSLSLSLSLSLLLALSLSLSLSL
jgi:hypothetical protein